jgi:hypothetical protein
MLAGAAYFFWIRMKSPLGAGACVAAGMLLKPPFGLVAIPIAVWLIWRERDVRALARLATPLAISAAAILTLNREMFGSYFRSSMPFAWGNPLIGLPGLLFSRTHGLFWISPLCVLAFWGCFRGRRDPKFAYAAAAGALYFLLMGCWEDWKGGFCFGPRLIVPALPLLYLGLAGFVTKGDRPNSPWEWGVLAAGAASVALNFLPAVFAHEYWMVLPLWR